jgi:hypothetical protein
MLPRPDARRVGNRASSAAIVSQGAVPGGRGLVANDAGDPPKPVVGVAEAPPRTRGPPGGGRPSWLARARDGGGLAA